MRVPSRQHGRREESVSDLPGSVSISEEGPREGFQIEPGPISSQNKIDLIDALSATGLRQIQVASFVSPKAVPGWADAEAVVAGFRAHPDVAYTGIWFNEAGLRRALAFRDRLEISGAVSLSASEAFSLKNLRKDRAGQLDAMRGHVASHQAVDVPVNRLIIMAAFGCNYAGDIAPSQAVATVADGMALLAEAGCLNPTIALADTMGWATPLHVSRVVGAVRERWPDRPISLHLHDTRGLGIANAYQGMRLGITRFDAAVAGLGGCPFAGQPGAPGNIATEELVLLCHEMGIETGVDLDALIEAARLAERIVGHRLPSAAARSGSLTPFRRIAA